MKFFLKNLLKKTKTNLLQTCNPHNETAVHCPMPDFNLPRNASWLNISDEVNKSMEVNVTQDSYFPKGRNIIPSFHPPIIIGTSEVFYFDTMLGESLKIEVSIFAYSRVHVVTDLRRDGGAVRAMRTVSLILFLQKNKKTGKRGRSIDH